MEQLEKEKTKRWFIRKGKLENKTYAKYDYFNFWKVFFEQTRQLDKSLNKHSLDLLHDYSEHY